MTDDEHLLRFQALLDEKAERLARGESAESVAEWFEAERRAVERSYVDSRMPSPPEAPPSFSPRLLSLSMDPPQQVYRLPLFPERKHRMGQQVLVKDGWEGCLGTIECLGHNPPWRVSPGLVELFDIEATEYPSLRKAKRAIKDAAKRINVERERQWNEEQPARLEALRQRAQQARQA